MTAPSRRGARDTLSMCSVETICHEMAGELRDVAGWLAGGTLTPEQYRAAVVEFEARKLARHRLLMSSALTDNGLVHFTLRHAENGELCASLDVDPTTGKLEIQHTTI